MRRIGVLLLVMAMGVVIASPAGAAKPDCNVALPTHPSCQDDTADQPLGGITCAERAALAGEDEDLFTEHVNGLGTHFDMTLGGNNKSACVDVMTDEGTWTVDIEFVQGSVRSLMLVPRDSIAPGDSCGGVHMRKPESDESGMITITLPGTDGAYVNTCGLDFGEWANGTFYDTVETGIPSPLAFQMDMTGSKDAVVILHVYLP